jgi:hypothetical protein
MPGAKGELTLVAIKIYFLSLNTKQMKKLFLATTISISLFSCKNSSDNEKTTKPADTVVASAVKDTLPVTTTPANTPTGFPTNFTPGKTFAADKADLHEYLKVQQLSEKKIAYEIYMVNGSCAEFKVQGVATMKEGDAESDSDEKNNGFFVDEYVDAKTKDCSVTIRIGADNGYTNRARFYLDACAAANTCKNKLGSEPLISK